MMSRSSDSPEVYDDNSRMIELKTALLCTLEIIPGANRIHYTVLKYMSVT